MRNNAGIGCKSKYGGTVVSSSTMVHPTDHTSYADTRNNTTTIDE